MKYIMPYVWTACILVTALISAAGQSADTQNTSTTENNELAKSATAQDGPSIWIHLFGGRRMRVEELTEAADGVWYKLGNVTTFIDRARFERIERSLDPRLTALSETFEGSSKWTIADAPRIESFFRTTFNRPLPLTAFGQSELHTRWGLDHRRSMDVGLHPHSLEGRTLIKFLVSEGIPFLAFRGNVPGVATGPHIHIGHGSPRRGVRQ